MSEYVNSIECIKEEIAFIATDISTLAKAFRVVNNHELSDDLYNMHKRLLEVRESINKTVKDESNRQLCLARESVGRAIKTVIEVSENGS